MTSKDFLCEIDTVCELSAKEQRNESMTHMTAACHTSQSVSVLNLHMRESIQG